MKQKILIIIFLNLFFIYESKYFGKKYEPNINNENILKNNHNNTVIDHKIEIILKNFKFAKFMNNSKYIKEAFDKDKPENYDDYILKLKKNKKLYKEYLSTIEGDFVYYKSKSIIIPVRLSMNKQQIVIRLTEEMDLGKILLKEILNYTVSDKNLTCLKIIKKTSETKGKMEGGNKNEYYKFCEIKDHFTNKKIVTLASQFVDEIRIKKNNIKDKYLEKNFNFKKHNMRNETRFYCEPEKNIINKMISKFLKEGEKIKNKFELFIHNDNKKIKEKAYISRTVDSFIAMSEEIETRLKVIKQYCKNYINFSINVERFRKEVDNLKKKQNNFESVENFKMSLLETINSKKFRIFNSKESIEKVMNKINNNS